ncbi:hypothetical protein T05_13749 [Trichinella murrelli]|uniref:Uncharacterized protein n=1 Tax=Trichinella murrelli TaxID=144512 RepID=A0A0V0SRK3_9BILA|nr:hypothetical protein T05_13749 [Trichinella murrelli]
MKKLTFNNTEEAPVMFQTKGRTPRVTKEAKQRSSMKLHMKNRYRYYG